MRPSRIWILDEDTVLYRCDHKDEQISLIATDFSDGKIPDFLSLVFNNCALLILLQGCVRISIVHSTLHQVRSFHSSPHCEIGDTSKSRNWGSERLGDSSKVTGIVTVRDSGLNHPEPRCQFPGHIPPCHMDLLCVWAKLGLHSSFKREPGHGPTGVPEDADLQLLGA